MSFDVPDDLYYLESHEWIDPDTGRVGISDFAQDELGDVVFVELPGEGDDFDQDESFGVVESIKAVSDIYAPVSGTVTDVNEDLADQPELVNEDPFGDGWLVELDFDDADLEDLLTADDYQDQVA
ncbi:glycine cleavage system protein GcvH [Halobacterium bonnevillei]|uniref:Probable glycine cleavage system H protein n=1 Tax=Halobacterium bonnevillei TaxID=2692200 RepID=A0A6B0SJ22_9EURY|nr:glycine cleavage system protein GcvH [Halobacterium bonnevillei]MXR19771.1 glycine cleavage system protein GcvH [Halobacterium bonnevillei]